MTDVALGEALLGNVEAGLRLLLKSEKSLYRQVAEVGIVDLARLHSLLLRAEKERDEFAEAIHKASLSVMRQRALATPEETKEVVGS